MPGPAHLAGVAAVTCRGCGFTSPSTPQLPQQKAAVCLPGCSACNQGSSPTAQGSWGVERVWVLVALPPTHTQGLTNTWHTSPHTHTHTQPVGKYTHKLLQQRTQIREMCTCRNMGHDVTHTSTDPQTQACSHTCGSTRMQRPTHPRPLNLAGIHKHRSRGTQVRSMHAEQSCIHMGTHTLMCTCTLVPLVPSSSSHPGPSRETWTRQIDSTCVLGAPGLPDSGLFPALAPESEELATPEQKPISSISSTP